MAAIEIVTAFEAAIQSGRCFTKSDDYSLSMVAQNGDRNYTPILRRNKMLYLNFITQSAKERGAGLAEYALLLALIAVVCVLALTGLGTAIRDIFDSIAGSL